MCARSCYNNVMKLKKTFALTLSILTASGAIAGAKLSLSAFADGALQQAESLVVFDHESATLHLPDSYEQYLPLENPTYVAMNEDYIAIADNCTIYVYDKAAGEYTRYDHEPLANQPTAVSKIQFSDDGEMFFRDAGNQLWRYNFETHDRDKDPLRDISCQTFLIHGDYLYFVTETNSGPSYFYYVPVADPQFSNRTELEKYSAASNPRMAYANDTLYCIINNNTVNAYDGNTHEFIGGGRLDKSLPEVTNLQFVCAYGNEFFYTVKGAGNQNNGLWRTDFEGNAEHLVSGDDFSTITSYGGKLYSIQGKTVREMLVKENAVELTGYEIAIDSSSPHRLANATETVRTKELVVIADAGNKRLSIYDRAENRYTILPCMDGSNAYLPEHIALDKEEVEVKLNGDVVTRNKIAVSSGTKIYEYIFERHSLKPAEDGVGAPEAHVALQNVKGLCYVYGECYYITDYDGYGVLSNPTQSELHFSGVSSPDAITSDVYGAIYVAFGNKVYSFREEDFLKEGASGNLVCTLSSTSDKVYTSLSVDYEGNVWYLSKDGTLLCNNTVRARIDGNAFVYLNEEHDYPVSFALSFEDDEIYFNFKNYVVKTNAFALQSLPTLNKIVSGEAKSKAFALADTSNLFVEIPKDAVGFEIALDELKVQEGDYFPYERYFRIEDTRRGALLYAPQEESGYYVVALYNSDLRTFTANLFKKSRTTLSSVSDCFKQTDETAYVASDISLLTAPCLFPAPKGERISTLSDTLLARGTRIKVLGYAEGEDRAYAFVEVEGEELKGFIPRSYLTKNDPLGVKQDDYILGYLKGGTGVVLKSANGNEIEITERTRAKLYLNEDGTSTAVVEIDGVTYSGIVKLDDIAHGETDALRISLIVILSVLALVIVFGYIFLMFPRKKKKK